MVAEMFDQPTHVGPRQVADRVHAQRFEAPPSGRCR
jgi:hypothetical protein